MYNNQNSNQSDNQINFVDNRAQNGNNNVPGDFQINYNMPNDNKNIKKPKKKSGYRKGLLTGIMSGVLSSVLVILLVLGILQKQGYLHLGTEGKVYVQDVSTNVGDGIGSKVEEKLNILDSVLSKEFYFDDIDEDKAADEIFKAYLNAYGDKYTVYYTPEEYKILKESTSGKFSGIGALCEKADDGSIRLVDVYEDSPAEKSGLQKGDCITTVDKKDIKDMDLSSAVALIKGEEDTQVALEYVRDGNTYNVNVTRAQVEAKTVEYEMKENSIGYISISQFDDVTKTQFMDALNDLKSQGMKSLIVDIRDNPGGMLTTVTEILDEILPDGLIMYTQDRDGKKTEYKGKNANELDVPMAVLVNGSSASASEIFAGAVQDYGVGKIIGTQTFGKGIVQTVRPLSDGSAVKYTIARYYTPKGQDIHGKGVTPDMVVEFPEGSQIDSQYEAAYNYLMEEMAK